jgi:24-hydroxycholesterol 7alpha-hydroxylase
MLGNAVPLGKQGADFLYQCWKRYGDAFTLHAAGQKMTFIFHPQSLVYYFRTPETELSFLPAVEQWTERVFGLPPADFLPRHHLILTSTRNVVGRNGAEIIHHHAETLIPLLKKGISQWLMNSNNNNIKEQKQQLSGSAWVNLELSEAVAKLVFSASVEALFGAVFLQRHGEGYLYQAFFEFEECFELAASPIPHFLQPKFKKARRKLLEAITKSNLSGDFANSTIGDLIQVSKMPLHAVPNMILAILWASQANTVPTVFWTLGFLLLPEHKDTYLKAIRARIDQGSDVGSSNLSFLSCDSSSLLLKCCMESLRLRSASTDVRIAAKNFILPTGHDENVLIEKGTMVMICPWISHMDPRLYEEQPKVFNPHRPGAALPCNRNTRSEKENNRTCINREQHGVAAGVGGLAGLAFGGGKFRCPGRSFAEMELGLVVGMIVHELEIELVLEEKESGKKSSEASAAVSSSYPGDPHGLLPAPDVRRLVGVKVPDGPCWVRIRQRER